MGDLYIGGYAFRWCFSSVVLNRSSRMYHQKFEPGVFRYSLRKHDQTLMIQHEAGTEIASTKDGSLIIKEDDIGLKFIAIVDSDKLSVKQRDRLNKASVGMVKYADKWLYQGNRTTRKILTAELIEISLIEQPAYPESVVFYEDTAEDLQKSFKRMALIHELEVAKYLKGGDNDEY